MKIGDLVILDSYEGRLLGRITGTDYEAVLLKYLVRYLAPYATKYCESWEEERDLELINCSIGKQYTKEEYLKRLS